MKILWFSVLCCLGLRVESSTFRCKVRGVGRCHGIMACGCFGLANTLQPEKSSGIERVMQGFWWGIFVVVSG